MGRIGLDLQARLLGRQPLRYHFEIIPQTVEGLQVPGSEQVSVVWEKGAKISYTDPSTLDGSGKAEFSQIMRQTATIYQQDSSLLPKEYSFKVQTVKQSSNRLLASSETRRKTIARAKLNLAQYCTPGVAAPATSEVAVSLQPAGVLHLEIRAVWLQHCSRPGSGRISDAGSFTDVSSQHSSENESLDGEETVDRTASVDMDKLADYANSHGGTRQTSSLASAATAHYNAPAGSASPPAAAVAAGGGSAARSLQQAASLPAAVTAAGGRPGSRSPDRSPGPAAGPGGVGNSRSRHRRTLSSPEHDIHPIQEAEREGLDAALSLERSASGQYSAVAAAVAAATPGDAGGAGSSTTGHQAGADAAEDQGSEGLRSLSTHLPSWLWPFSRDAVRGATTDQLMRQIAAAEDVGKLQQLCRGLLCERNDWRYKASQLDRNVQGLQNQVQQLQHANTNLLQQLHSVEAQVGQLQQDSLVDRLVEAKLQLAQADLANTALRGQLNKERERSRQWAAKFTTLQVMYESLLEQEAAREGGYAIGAICTTPDATSRRSSVDASAGGAGSSGGDQGEGLSALGQGAAGFARKLSSSGWAGFWAPAGPPGASAAGGGAGGVSRDRRLSSPSDGDAPGDAAAAEQQRRAPRHSIA